MAWSEYEILGAYRDSGEPARLLIEAASESDAKDFATSKGVLISRVVERSDPPADARSRVGTTPTHDEPRRQRSTPAILGDSIRLASNAIPDLKLLSDEHLIASFDASPREIGIKGIMLGDKRRVVLTNHRVIFFQRNLMGATLSSVRLADASAIRYGATVHGLTLTFGISSVVLGGYDLIRNLTADPSLGGSLGASLGVAGMADSIRTGLVTLDASSIIFGLLMILASRSRILGVYAGGTLHAIRLRALKAGRSSDFVNALTQAIDEPSQAEK